MSHAQPSYEHCHNMPRDEAIYSQVGGVEANSAAPLISQSVQMQQWQRYIEQKIGFVLPEGQERWLVNAINETAAAHQLTVGQLWAALPVKPVLTQALLDAVLIPESRFFRHKPSIAFATKRAFEYQQQRMARAPYRIWSVGCAAGQEVWSLAMSLQKAGVTDYHILGSDANQQILDHARTGHFDARQRRLIPKAYDDMIWPPGEDVGSFGNHWQVADSLRHQVRFVRHNIFMPNVPVQQLQHLIICQNMLIYFRQFDQRDILTRLASACAIGGYVVLAPGEALFWRPKNMRRIDHSKVNVWQKISA